jgi:hypothetical protein
VGNNLFAVLVRSEPLGFGYGRHEENSGQQQNLAHVEISFDASVPRVRDSGEEFSDPPRFAAGLVGERRTLTAKFTIRGTSPWPRGIPVNSRMSVNPVAIVACRAL